MASLRHTVPWATRTARSGARPLRFRPRSQNSRALQRRGYADHGDHGHGKGFGEGPDWPWAVSSFSVTGLGVYWLLANDPLKDVDTSASGHGHTHHGAGEGDEEAEEESGEKSSEGGSEEGGESGGDEEQSEEKDDKSKSGNASDDSASESDEGKDTPASSEDEDDQKADNSPDKQEVYNEDGVKKSKGPGYHVRTGAKHKSEPHGNSEKSQKAEGVVETAKIKGVIDSKNRPAK